VGGRRGLGLKGGGDPSHGLEPPRQGVTATPLRYQRESSDAEPEPEVRELRVDPVGDQNAGTARGKVGAGSNYRRRGVLCGRRRKGMGAY